MNLAIPRRALAGLAALPAAAQNAPSLTIAIGGSITSVDPHFFNAAPNSSLALHIFNTLINRSATAQLEPALATEWRALEDQLWEFKLRQGVAWHDGRPFTAEDVAFTVQRAPNVPNSPGGFGGFLRSIARTEIVDAHTIRFHTSYPNPILPNEIASIFIISKHAGEGAATEDYNSGRAAIGTGPYRLASHRAGDRTELVRNENYWGGAEPWARVSYRFIANDAARTAALLAGDVDMIDQVASTDLARLKRDPRVAVSETIGLRCVYLSADFSRTGAVPGVTDNAGQPLAANPFFDVRVRRALDMAIARDAIADRIMEGQAVATAQWLPAGVFSFAPDVRVRPQDIEGARRLLAEAGFPQGFRLTLTTPNDRFPNDARIAQAVAQMWTRAGVQTSVDALPWSSYSIRSSRQEFAMRLSSWGSVTAEGIYMLANIMQTHNVQRRTGSSNLGRYSNAELDALTDRAASTIDDTTRERIIQDGIRFVQREAVIMPLIQLSHSWATRSALTYQARMDERTVAMGVRPRTA